MSGGSEANETPDGRSLKIRGGVKASNSAPLGLGALKMERSYSGHN